MRGGARAGAVPGHAFRAASREVNAIRCNCPAPQDQRLDLNDIMGQGRRKGTRAAFGQLSAGTEAGVPHPGRCANGNTDRYANTGRFA